MGVIWRGICPPVVVTCGDMRLRVSYVEGRAVDINQPGMVRPRPGHWSGSAGNGSVVFERLYCRPPPYLTVEMPTGRAPITTDWSVEYRGRRGGFCTRF